MSSAEFIIEQETDEEEKLGVSEQTAVQDEDRQCRQLDNIWEPQIPLHTTDDPQHICKEEEEFLSDQQPCNQQRNGLDQEHPESPQIKEEQENFCTYLNQNYPHSLQIKAEPEDPEPPEIKKEQEECCINLDQKESETPKTKEEQVELCTSLDQEDLKPLQIKEEQDDFCSSQEEEQLALKQEINICIVTSDYEESDHSEPEPNHDEPLFHNSPVAQSPDQEGNKVVESELSRSSQLKTKKRYRRNRIHSVDNSSMSESQCDTHAGKMSLKCDVCEKVFLINPNYLYIRGVTQVRNHMPATCVRKDL
ncbi:uncharacterized protein LOC127535475 [Acanthochromis polyacanthus]|uniref:uncharacterized protein LOC127535475 n=1 Tax=Acanthochromis polyacanthus TaxID=80966 RepID=UPI0022348FBE|nr:uncharacterized protein LOC127535475 [Acanthochromis polyacanthus]